MSFEDWDNSYNDSVDTINGIINVDSLVSIFGRFPTFCDSEVKELQLIRGNTLECIENNNWEKHDLNSLSARIYLFDERYSEDDERRSPLLFTILFSGLEQLDISGFNHQNAMCGMGIRRWFSDNRKQEMFKVDWGGAAINHKVSLICETIIVSNIERITKEQRG